MNTCGKIVTIENPAGNGKSSIPCLLEPQHAGDCDPRFRPTGLHNLETFDPKALDAPDEHTISLNDAVDEIKATFSVDDFVARCVKLSPRRGDFVFVSIPHLSTSEIAPIAKKLVDLFGEVGAQCIVANQRIDVLDEKSMAEFGWVRTAKP